MPKPRNIHEANQAIRAAVPYLQTKRADGLRFPVLFAADVLSAIRPLLETHGVDIYPSDSLVVFTEPGVTEKGTPTRRVIVRNVYTFAHTGGSGEVTTLAVAVHGEAIDTGDNATAQAMTAALKACLRQVYLIETGEQSADARASSQVMAEEQRARAMQRAILGAADTGEVGRIEATITRTNYPSKTADYLLGLCTTQREKLKQQHESANGRAPARGKTQPA